MKIGEQRALQCRPALPSPLKHDMVLYARPTWRQGGEEKPAGVGSRTPLPPAKGARPLGLGVPWPRCHGGPGPARTGSSGYLQTPPEPSPCRAAWADPRQRPGSEAQGCPSFCTQPLLHRQTLHLPSQLKTKTHIHQGMDLRAAQWWCPLAGCLGSLACQVMPVFPRGREALVTHIS